jgi:hypothetical protein
VAFDTGDIRIRVKEVRGAARIEREFEQLPKQARDELRDGLNKLTAKMANRVRAAGRASSRQAARAATTVRPSRGLRPQVAAGPHKLLFLSEFGMDRHTGWYGHSRYNFSPGRQARPHLGLGGSYWFFRTAEHEEALIRDECREIADRIIANWR